MLATILSFSVAQRWLVVLLTLVAAALGVCSLLRLPIDAVPDITNNQVQINTIAPALSPVEIEKQVTLPARDGAGRHPGARIHALALAQRFFAGHRRFSATTSTSISRASRSTNALTRGQGELAARRRAADGADLDRARRGLHVDRAHYERPTAPSADRGRQAAAGRATGRYLTPEGQRLATDIERAAYLRTVQDWIIRPQLKSGDGRRRRRRRSAAIEKQYHVQPDPMKLIALGLTFADVAEGA